MTISHAEATQTDGVEGAIASLGYGPNKDYVPRFNLEVDLSLDANLLPFSIATLQGNYTLNDEGPQDVFMRSADYYANDENHAARIYSYISRGWFMPATPILSNAGGLRGLPISCFTNETDDSIQGIRALWNENTDLASKGGGIGSYWGNLRSIGEPIGKNGKTSGVIPFIRVMDSLSLAISQGSLRRGSAAVYLPVWHPEIEEFVEMRRPTGGDPNRKALNLHHGVVVTDDFMRAAKAGEEWGLRSPKTQKVIRKVSARALMERILLARMEQGEPYIIYGDTVNACRPTSYRRLELLVSTSNLCAEINLTTGPDHLGAERTGVCCLSSVNLRHWAQFKNNPQFFIDVFYFLDNVLEDFIKRAPPEMRNAVYAAIRERSVGLGVMGFHTMLQERSIVFGSPESYILNRRIFARLRKMADWASHEIAKERGPCEDAAELGLMERFTHKLAVAPTASISNICSCASPGIEPISANVFNQKTLHGNFFVRNQTLDALLTRLDKNTHEVWNDITRNQGSVQHLDFLTPHEKAVFRTAFEIPQMSIIELAGGRSEFLCQGQSVNLFLLANVHKSVLLAIHFRAWELGLKSLYYCRSLSLQRADNISNDVTLMDIMRSDEEVYGDAGVSAGATAKPILTQQTYEECLSCQ